MELTPIVLSGFKRVNDKVAPDLLGNDEATVLQDVVLDYKLGKPVKRGHWSRYDAGVSAGNDINTLADIDLNGVVFLIAISNVSIGGTHDGGNDQSALTDSTANWGINVLIGKTIQNATDGSSGTITANTATTVTATLSGGSENDWDTGDSYVIIEGGSEISLYDISANSWSGYIGGLTTGAKFKIIPFGNSYIFTFDTDDDPKQVDKTTSAVTNLELDIANVSGITSYSGTGGDLTPSTHYRYVIVGLTEDGQIGRVSQPFTHYSDTTRFLTTDASDSTCSKVYWKNLPYIADARVKSRMIFRTKGEELIAGSYKIGQVFYLLTILDNDSTGTSYQTEFEDNVADIDLGTETAVFLNMPTRSKHIAFSNERLFLANFSQINRNFISPPSSNTGNDGAHTGSNNQATVMTDSNASFLVDELIGKVIHNITDGSSGTITDNTATTVTVASLSGGTGDDWDTGDTYVILPSGYTTDTYELSITDTNGGAEPGTLDDSEQYDYIIHYEDKLGRLSQFYLNIGVTTDAGTAADDHKLTIQGIGSLSDFATEEYPSVVIFRQTGGSGDYNFIARLNLRRSDYTNEGYVWSRIGKFIDKGATEDTSFVWSDPELDIESYPSAVAFSEISHPSSFRDENKKQIFFDDGDPITGLFDDREGVIVFKKNSISKLFPNGAPENWRLIKLVKEYGCDQSTTLQRSGSSYYFIYKNRAYRYDYGAEKPVDIGFYFQSTLDLVVAWYDSTINDKWYVLQGLIGTTYYTFIYDIKLDTWYKFKRPHAGSEDAKTLYFTKYGSSEQLLSNCDDYVSLYNPLNTSSSVSRADTETGSTVQISPLITSKTFRDDGVNLVRFRKLKFDYTKLDDQTVAISITDKDTGATIGLGDTTNGGNIPKLYEANIGTASDTLKQSRSFNVAVGGVGFVEWDNLRIEGRPIHKGKQVSL